MVSSQKTKNKGFTIVELLIVIIVIGILATLVIALFTSAKKKARDSQRQTDIVALQGYIEGYYAETGKYPTLANMNDTAAEGFRETSLEGLDPAALFDPKDNRASADTYASTASALVDSTTEVENRYAYSVLPANCDNETTDCASYTLIADLEGNPGTFKKSSN